MMTDGSEESRRRQSRMYTLLIAGIGALGLAIVLFAPVAIKMLTAPNYHGAIGIMPILVLAWLFQGFYWIASNRVFFLGGGHWLATATVSSVIVSAGLSLLLIPGMGAHGAAWALVGCFLVRFVVIAVIGERLYPLPWQLGAIARVLAGVVTLWALDYFLLAGLGPWSAIPFKLLLLLAMIPLARICGVVSSREIAEARAAVGESLRGLIRGPRAGG
jgi:O-antigen/teichoic acid export membrane protein